MKNTVLSCTITFSNVTGAPRFGSKCQAYRHSSAILLRLVNLIPNPQSAGTGLLRMMLFYPSQLHRPVVPNPTWYSVQELRGIPIIVVNLKSVIFTFLNDLLLSQEMNQFAEVCSKDLVGMFTEDRVVIHELPNLHPVISVHTRRDSRLKEPVVFLISRLSRPPASNVFGHRCLRSRCSIRNSEPEAVSLNGVAGVHRLKCVTFLNSRNNSLVSPPSSLLDHHAELRPCWGRETVEPENGKTSTRLYSSDRCPGSDKHLFTELSC